VFECVVISEDLEGVHSISPVEEIVIPSGSLLREYVIVPE
jgi:hypothetical protein